MASIIPGKSLGFLTLGAPLHTTLAQLRASPTSFPSIKVVYSETDPATKPITIELKYNGLRLRFDGAQQRLRLIEVLEFGKIGITYKNQELCTASNHSGVLGSINGTYSPSNNNSSTQLNGSNPSINKPHNSTKVSFGTVYNKVFGPTYPGKYYPEHGVYILSYPGIAFSFNIDRNTAAGISDFIGYFGKKANSTSCSSLCLFKGNDWNEAKEGLFRPDNFVTIPDPVMPTSGPTNSTSTANLSKQISFVEVNPTVGTLDFHFKGNSHAVNPFVVAINTTTIQDVIMNLGPPSERFLKQDSRLSIHTENHRRNSGGNDGNPFSHSPSPANNGANDSPVDYSNLLFFNYFNLGLDVAFSNSIVKKLILHGNLPGAVDFQKYARCQWRLVSVTEAPDVEDADYVETLLTSEETYKPRNGSKPMHVNRLFDNISSSVELIGGEDDVDGSNNGEDDEGLHFEGTNLYGEDGVVFEVMKNGFIVSLTIY